MKMESKKNTSSSAIAETNVVSILCKYSLRNQSTPLKKHLKFDDHHRTKSKRRRKPNRNEKMKDIITNIEKDIEEQLDTKTVDNDFAGTDVKGILKELILDEDMKEMVRQTLHPGENRKCYEPKLTRAKVRKLLELKPDLAIPILGPIPQTNNNFVSECLELINIDYSENSSEDEEYKPEEDDKSEYADSLFQSEYDNIDREEMLNGSLDLSTNPPSVDADNLTLEEENIGQRTRSKLPLTETLIEDIEQRFKPPDITSDMYETEVDNEDYVNFLIECTKSSKEKCLELTDADDDQDDPEFLPADAEIVDAEELRRDKTTEVPSEELKDLLAQLEKEYMRTVKALTANKKVNGTNTITTINEEPSRNKENDPTENCEPQIPNPELTRKGNVVQCPFLTVPQKLLFQQQLRQHVQLTTLHFLQCHKHQTLFKYASELKNMLVSLKLLVNSNKKSAFYASNLDDALNLVTEWEELCTDFPEPVDKFMIPYKRGNKRLDFPAELMKNVCKSCAFLYPLLLPEMPFSFQIITHVHKREITLPEEWLLVIGLEQFYEYVQKNMKLNRAQTVLRESLKLINHYLLPNFTPTFLHKLIKRRSLESEDNYIKFYLKNKKAPPLKHFIIPVCRKPLYQQPLDLLPEVWQNYIEKNFVVVKFNG